MMKKSVMFAMLAALLFIGNVSGSSRTLLQSANPPNPSFGGPALKLDASVSPSGTTTKINWRGVGTQNYSSAANSQYAAAGAVADMFLQNGTSPVGKHFFVKNGDGSISPAFTRVDAQGNLLGTIIGAAVANTSAPAYNNDGGYGSIPTLLLRTTFADGFFSGVTYIQHDLTIDAYLTKLDMQRLNTLGGVVPGNPKLFTLPASPSGVANFLLAVPYQADYLFLVNNGSPPASG